MKNRDAFEELGAAMGSTNSKEKKMKIFYQNLNHSVEADKFSTWLLNDTMPERIDKSLRRDMMDSLKGFTDEVALEIADNLIDCWSGLGLHVTGIKHVDELLGGLYMRILDCAHRKGVKFAYWK